MTKKHSPGPITVEQAAKLHEDIVHQESYGWANWITLNPKDQAILINAMSRFLPLVIEASAPDLAAENLALRDLATELSDILAGLTDEYWELLSDDVLTYDQERLENYNQVTPILKKARDLGVWKPPSDILEGNNETDKPE